MAAWPTYHVVPVLVTSPGFVALLSLLPRVEAGTALWTQRHGICPLWMHLLTIGPCLHDASIRLPCLTLHGTFNVDSPHTLLPEMNRTSSSRC
jgi:hypothetical protein